MGIPYDSIISGFPVFVNEKTSQYAGDSMKKIPPAKKSGAEGFPRLF